jgi:outer membrane protein TolC
MPWKPALLLLLSTSSHAAGSVISLTLAQAESRALEVSDQVQAAAADARAARELARAQFAGVVPRPSLEARYGYVTNVPTLQFAQSGSPIRFGTHDSYSVGPQLTYTVWDTGSAWKAYRGQYELAQAGGEDLRDTRRSLRLSVGTAYVEVQLALEALKLVDESLSVARSHNQDIEANFRAGAASRLDLLDSRRAVISYQLQFRARQAELASALRDLLALMRVEPGDLSRPGLPGMASITMEVRLEQLEEALVAAENWRFTPPDGGHPKIHAQELQARAADLQAESLLAQALPVIQASAKASEDYPNAILPQSVRQNTFGVNLSLPIFEAGRSRHLAKQKREQAQAQRRRAAQSLVDLRRDYERAFVLAQDLRERRDLAAQDVAASRESARLYYQSYKVGRINLIDVQNADLRALQSQVNAADLAAQLLRQLVSLRYLSEDGSNDQ